MNFKKLLALVCFTALCMGFAGDTRNLVPSKDNLHKRTAAITSSQAFTVEEEGTKENFNLGNPGIILIEYRDDEKKTIIAKFRKQLSELLNSKTTFDSTQDHISNCLSQITGTADGTDRTLGIFHTLICYKDRDNISSYFSIETKFGDTSDLDGGYSGTVYTTKIQF